MKSAFNILTAVFFVNILFVTIDLILTKNHERDNGPYVVRLAEVVSFSASCGYSGRHMAVNYELKVTVENQLEEVKKPFIGLYPGRICFFRIFYPLYDRDKFEMLVPGRKVEVMVDKNGGIYLGKTEEKFNYALLSFLLICFFTLIVLRKRGSGDSD